MKSLKTLVKLNKSKLDKLLAEINNSEDKKAVLKDKRNQIISEAQSETDKYHGTEFAYMLDKYLLDSRKNQEKISAQIQNLEMYIVRLRHELSNQYTELKKYEIALERKEFIQLEKLKKFETKELDEFNTSKFVYDKKSIPN
jgi:flagellar biosynthesis chaperone FliJ